MNRLIPLVLLLGLSLASVGCKGAPPPRSVSRLYFGLSGPDGPIKEEEFQRFVDEEVIKELPSGFTIYEAEGAWDSGEGTKREAARVLEVVHFERDRQALLRLRDLYAERFKQDSVLYVRFPLIESGY